MNDDAARMAARFINSTKEHVFLTGRAGTGKTTFLRHIRRRTHKNTIVAAPTGIAAINAEGVTLHSLFQLPFGAFIPSDQFPDEASPAFEINTPRSIHQHVKMQATKRNMIRKLELLIIDEVSMLRADLLDVIDTVLRRIRRRSHQPFGGVQILFIGDLQQLPPVVKNDEWRVLNQYYQTLFFFGARALESTRPIHIELQHIYRQSDPIFIDLLNNLRDGGLTDRDIDHLNRNCRPGFTAAAGDGYVYLTTHNHKADKINRTQLAQLPGKAFQYQARVEGTFDARAFPVDETLKLKENAQVMFIKNDYSGEQRFFNGKIGRVKSLQEDGVQVVFDDGTPPVWVDEYIWENKRYTLNKESGGIEEKVIGTFVHFPLKLAWAITIHKSQGLTFNKAIIDVSQAFAAGQVYVALSRLTSLTGLILTAPFRRHNLAREPALEIFERQLPSLETLQESLQSASLAYLEQTVRGAFDFGNLLWDVDLHLRTYNKDTSHSRKQHFMEWARTLRADLVQTKEVADKFLKQLDKILPSSPDDHFAYLTERVEAAKNYFDPLLAAFSGRIKKHAEGLKNEKGVKQYIRELQDLELLFHGSRQHIYKALSLIQAIAQDRPLTNVEMGLPSHENAVSVTGFGGKNTDPTKYVDRRQKSIREKKPDTRQISLELFNSGKTVKQIAENRALTLPTIQRHLAYWVESGVIDIDRLVPKEAQVEITAAFDKLATFHLKPVYEFLKKKYDYGALKFTAAFLRRGKNET